MIELLISSPLSANWPHAQLTIFTPPTCLHAGRHIPIRAHLAGLPLVEHLRLTVDFMICATSGPNVKGHPSCDNGYTEHSQEVIRPLRFDDSSLVKLFAEKDMAVERAGWYRVYIQIMWEDMDEPQSAPICLGGESEIFWVRE